MLMRRVLSTQIATLSLLCIVKLLAAATTETGGHTSNWAVIVNTSRYWFNYRFLMSSGASVLNAPVVPQYPCIFVVLSQACSKRTLNIHNNKKVRKSHQGCSHSQNEPLS